MRVTVDGEEITDAVQTGPAEEAVGAGWPFAEGGATARRTEMPGTAGGR